MINIFKSLNITVLVNMLLIVLLLLIVIGTEQVYAQETEFTIDRVEVIGTKRIPSSRISEHIVKQGDQFNPEILNKTVRALYETGFFSEVEIDAEVIGNDFVITYILKEFPIVSSIQYRGNKKLKESRFEKMMNIKRGETLNFNKVGVSLQGIYEAYEKAGYMEAEVTHEVRYHTESSVDIVFHIKEGKLARVYNIWFFGNESFSDFELRRALDTKQKSFWSKLSNTGKTSTQTLEIDREKLINYYKSHGYLNVEVSDSEIEFQDEKDKMNYILRVNEGDQFKINSIRYAGSDSLFSSEDLALVTVLKVGDPFNVDQYLADIDKVRSKYTELGHAMAYAEDDTRINDYDKTVDIIVHIEAGKIFNVSRINIVGNDHSRDNVIRRQSDLIEGQRYNSKLIEEMQANLGSLGYYQNIQVREKQVGDDELELTVEIVEQKDKTAQFTFTMGYSNYDKLSTQFGVKFNNFLGTDRKVGAYVEFASKKQDFVISYEDPWIFDKPYSFGVTLFDRKYEYNDYDADSLGGSITIGHQPIKRRVFIDYTIGKEDTKIKGISSDASEYVWKQKGRHEINYIGIGISYQHLDNAMDPKNGLKASINTQLAGTFLGGTSDFFELRAQTTYHKNIVGNLIGSVNIEGGQIWTINDADIPIHRRYELGGMHSVRGYKNYDISPKDSKGRNYGGDKYYQMNIEAWHPLVEGNMVIRGVVFFDLGQVHKEGSRLFTDDPKMSTGFGVRFMTPLGLMRLEYGFKLNREKGEDSGRLELSVGSTF